jgi:hypothetical protein
MGERPRGTTIERERNEGNYEPGNCIWGTPVQQGNNKRNNRFIEFEGNRLTLAQWARRLEITPQGLAARLKSWSIEKALTTK